MSACNPSPKGGMALLLWIYDATTESYPKRGVSMIGEMSFTNPRFRPPPLQRVDPRPGSTITPDSERPPCLWGAGFTPQAPGPGDQMPLC